MNERVRTCIQVIRKCSEPHSLGEASLCLGDPAIEQTLFLVAYFFNGIKNNITSSVINIIVCLLKNE